MKLISAVHDSLIFDIETCDLGPYGNAVASEDAYPVWAEMKKTIEDLMKTAKENNRHLFMTAYERQSPWKPSSEFFVAQQLGGWNTPPYVDTVMAMHAAKPHPSVYEQLAAIEPED